MKFDPLSDEELKKQRGVLTPGPANFEILEAADTVSKSSGNPMIKLQLRVWDKDGREGIIFDYLTSNAQWKIKNLLESIGCIDLYGSGEIDPGALVGSGGNAIIFIEKDRTGQYGDSVKIRDYVIKPQNKETTTALASDDDIPF